MATIDIREGIPIDKIQFEEELDGSYQACYILPGYDGEFSIKSADGDCLSVKVENVDNLIKALQKAKELWGKS